MNSASHTGEDGLAGLQKLPESTGEAENGSGLWSAQRLPGSLAQPGQLEPQLATPGTAGQAAAGGTGLALQPSDVHLALPESSLYFLNQASDWLSQAQRLVWLSGWQEEGETGEGVTGKVGVPLDPLPGLSGQGG